MAVNLPECPASMKQINHYLKTANEHDGRDIVVSYWCRLYALQVGMKLSTKLPEETALLLGLMDYLESTKKEHHENEAISNEVVAQAHLENYALKLFQYADKQDRESNFGKNVVKAFYTSGMLYDVLQTFGELTEEALHNRKYAKWKAAYIHTCLKNGETPLPGPMPDDEDDTNATDYNENQEVGGDEPPTSPKPTTPPSDLSSSSSLPPAPTAEEVLKDPTKLPSPPQDEERNPGGFVAYVPTQPISSYVPPPVNAKLTPDQIQKAQKYCRYAGSALNYDDIKSAIENLQRGLHLLQTGQEMP